MTDLVVHQPTQRGALTIAPDQQQWTDAQAQALGFGKNVNAAEAAIFLHTCQRTGLDPFIRQIYMIERWTKDGPRQTIQTGIDGYRLIARRAGRYSITKRVWLDENAAERPIWLKKWGTPAACLVVVERDGAEFPGMAMFDEYAQTTKGGGLNAMWQNMPANQIAKCAEALALRMAFPHDLSGIYTEDEMGQADNAAPTPTPKPRGMDALRQAVAEPAEPVEMTAQRVDGATGEVPEDEPAPISDGQRKAIFAAMSEVLTTDARTAEGKAARLDYLSNLLGRRVESTNDLTAAEASRVLDALKADAADAEGEPS